MQAGLGIRTELDRPLAVRSEGLRDPTFPLQSSCGNRQTNKSNFHEIGHFIRRRVTCLRGKMTLDGLDVAGSTCCAFGGLVDEDDNEDDCCCMATKTDK